MDSLEESQVRKDHARSQSEHGHWLKDLEIWERQNREAGKILDKMESLLDDFSQKVATHKSFIEEHRQLLKMHEDAISWRHDHHRGKDEQGTINFHKTQEDTHHKQREVHQSLRGIREEIMDEVSDLADLFGVTH